MPETSSGYSRQNRTDRVALFLPCFVAVPAIYLGLRICHLIPVRWVDWQQPSFGALKGLCERKRCGTHKRVSTKHSPAVTLHMHRNDNSSVYPSQIGALPNKQYFYLASIKVLP